MPDLRALILALPNPVVLVGGDERIHGLNAQATTLLGVNAESWHYITALRQPTLLDAVEATLSDQKKRNARYLGNDGTRETVWDVSVEGVSLRDQKIVVLSFDDQTALEDAGQMRRDFVANVSHELRTPLTSMIGFIETLRGPARGDVDAQDKFLAIMEQEAARMHRLVEDLLSLSRVQDQERVRPTQTIAFEKLLMEVLDTLKPAADARGVRFELEVPDGPVEVLGDHSQLWQVISNLIENAVKYGKSDGRVKISLTAPRHEPALLQSGVRLRVKDEGEGIPAHHLARLTERFYRVDTHRSREVGGTGLGLAIVKHIISRHRGRLRIASKEGQGSEFIVILPSKEPRVDP